MRQTESTEWAPPQTAVDMSLAVTRDDWARVDRPVGGRAKRASDLAFAFTCIVLLLPLIATIALLIWLQDRGPVFYSQKRLGYRGRMFSCYKFRSMVPNANQVLSDLLERDAAARLEWEQTRKLKRDPRCTTLGRILRKTSLDELPQLINILRGDMSLIGPRPIVQAERSYYGRIIHLYEAARPGLTGLWQVSGRNDTSYTERVELDGRYVSNWSWRLDASIFIRTFAILMSGRGSY
jgi:exopolysaccharide production protein ExoY